MKTIVVPVDFSNDALQGLETALIIANKTSWMATIQGVEYNIDAL